MRKQLKMIYHHHSGFSVQVDESLLVFDYWRGENNDLAEKYRLHTDFLKQFDNVYIFVSHSHPDHLDPVIFEWAWKAGHVVYLLGEGVETREALPVRYKMRPGDSVQLRGNITVTAYPSTDLGVSFYVTVGELGIFHAGDLNLWHWCEESSPEYVNQAEAEFNEALRQIGPLRMDVCMFPLDPRMGKLYSLGAERFIMLMKPAIFIPMHFFQYNIAPNTFANDFGRYTQFTKILPLTEDGKQFTLNINIPEDGSPRHYSIEAYCPPDLVRAASRQREDVKEPQAEPPLEPSASEEPQ